MQSFSNIGDAVKQNLTGIAPEMPAILTVHSWLSLLQCDASAADFVGTAKMKIFSRCIFQKRQTVIQCASTG
ncbi:MAG: hypothetical protein RMI34_06135 [Chloroherpetonaceae bacterium]|nr:hypothetical protein [Chloroherpetonaceae bacterium]MCS7210528.1 hypothetical protein [Chloroherpetonaceae bacterium]MDW8019638.1 hypothetical protein [Chloroherpetonaceae bacterium]MDW8467167.1 hypothetical protein [Chloroherpetonaceae bacterium]